MSCFKALVWLENKKPRTRRTEKNGRNAGWKRRGRNLGGGRRRNICWCLNRDVEEKK